jgi:DNA invertase Pin-like site-specific DNA recombinase
MRKVESMFLAVLAYSYLRFSDPAQAKGDSYRRQTDLRDAWLKRNKVKLDTSLTLEDKGVSGFFGDHRRNPDRYALAAFLDLVKKGRIAKGSYLIVENLDRLSREDIIPALSLLLDLIQAGIRVVQLLPVETIFDAQANPMILMMAIMELSRGHSESAMKSERVGRAWQEKKRRAAEDKTPLTAKTPSWLRLIDGEWEVDREAADTIRRIYRMAIDGYGVGLIVKKLNAEKVPVAGGGDHWALSSVSKILSNRALVGEYQPYKGRAGKRDKNGKPCRKPDGKPIPGYYPAIITEDEWYAARAALASRKNKVGRLPSGDLNLFNGLLRDARDGGSYQLTNKGKKGGGKILVPYNAVRGLKGSTMVSFPAKTFEDAILSCLREIDPLEILPDDKGENKTLVLEGQLAEVEAEIEKFKNRLQERYSDAVAEVLERREDEQKRLLADWKEAQQKAASPLSEAWGQCKTLLKALESAPDQMEARLRLRSALRRIVEAVYCLFVPRGAKRLATAQIRFAGGDKHRDYLILHRPEKANAACRIPSSWYVCSLDDVHALGPLDLRKSTHAKKLEALLAGVDLETLLAAMQAQPRLQGGGAES